MKSDQKFGIREVLSSNKMMVAIATVVAIIGLIQSLSRNDFTWFARCGSLIVGVGIVLLSRTSITGNDLLLNIGDSDTGKNLNSREYFKGKNEPVPEYVEENEASRAAIGWIGPLISFIGTVIWGYGDLLNVFLSKVKC